MRFDSDALARLTAGDATALAEPVEFDDGTVKRLADCNRFDLLRMDAWMTYQVTLAGIGVDECDDQLRRRRGRLRAVDQ